MQEVQVVILYTIIVGVLNLFAARKSLYFMWFVYVMQPNQFCILYIYMRAHL